MKNKIIFAMLGCLLITACGQKKESAETESPAPENKTAIELTSEQINTVGVELGSIEQKNLKSVVKANGYLKVPPQNQASVSSFLGGVVKSITIMEGDYVKQGQLLATIENPDFIKLQQQYLESKNSLAYLEKEYNRQKNLFTENVSSEKIFQKSESDYNTQKSNFLALGKQLKLLNVSLEEISKGNLMDAMPIVAPINGNIGHIGINIGKNIQPNEKLFDIIDNSKILVDLLVYEKDLFKVKVGQNVHFVLSNLPEHQDEHKGKTIEGEIFGINKNFENDTKALMVHAAIKNENHELISGMYVNALIEVGEEKSSAVPSDAIVKSEGKEYIFIEESKKKNQFKMVEVITGVSDLGYTEIKPVEKLPADVKVVTKGAFFLISKMKAGEFVGEE